VSRINTTGVILGGVVAGVVANVIDFVSNSYLMVNESTEMMQRLNLKPDVLEHSMWTWIGFDFVYGFLVIFTYAAIRPRFGPGPKTALIAGVCYWIAFGAMAAGFTAMGIFTHQAFIKSTALSLASTLIPALVGAYIYKEKDAE
jgi:hypothetical protein